MCRQHLEQWRGDKNNRNNKSQDMKAHQLLSPGEFPAGLKPILVLFFLVIGV